MRDLASEETSVESISDLLDELEHEGAAECGETSQAAGADTPKGSLLPGTADIP